MRNTDLWSWESNVGHCAHSCKLLDDNKTFSKKTWKEITIIFIYVLSKVSIYLCQKISRYIMRKKEHWKKDKNGTVNNS